MLADSSLADPPTILNILDLIRPTSSICHRVTYGNSEDSVSEAKGSHSPLFPYLSPRELLRLSWSCRRAYFTVSAYMKDAFDVDSRLRRFFSDVTAFRCIQARTGTLISGSFALQFFDRTYYPSSDLDLYVHLHHRREVGRWLLGAGYVFSPGRHQDPDFEVAVLRRTQSRGFFYTMPGIAAILTFYRSVDNGRTPVKVQLIVARRTPMEIILGFHSTCVMNVISFENAYCLFPIATVEDHHSLLSYSSQGKSTRRQEGLLKYVERGFRMSHRLSPEDLDPSYPSPFIFGPRWIGDADTWIIPLDVTGVEGPPSPSLYSSTLLKDPVAVAGFSVRYDHEEGAIMTFSVLQSAALRYSYIIGDDNTVDHLLRVVFAKEQGEHRKVLECSLEDWRYWDAELPRICRDYMQNSSNRKLWCLRDR